MAVCRVKGCIAAAKPQSGICGPHQSLPDDELAALLRRDIGLVAPIRPITDRIEYEPANDPKPHEHAKHGRCGAVNQDGEPCICSRRRGHTGPHRGPSPGGFYAGPRYKWDADEKCAERQDRRREVTR